ncbi:MAG: helix-turn-helix domain-containing protein [Allorhizobium sp.]
MELNESPLNLSIANRLKQLRSDKNLTLDDLAAQSGVSRAMISRIERAEASPTAVLLARLCSALGQSLSSFFEGEGTAASPLAKKAEQPLWRDPATGYVRRSVSAPGTGSRVDIVEVDFPPGAIVHFPYLSAARLQWQHLWLFEGALMVTVAGTRYPMLPGDCLHMNIADEHVFENTGDTPARYAVVIDRG